MDELEKSLKYVPTYQVIEQIRKEEKKIARDAVRAANNRTKAAKEKAKELELQLIAAVNFLKEKDISIEQIAQILNISLVKVQRIIEAKKKI